MITEATLTCPHCQHQWKEDIPENICVAVHRCTSCHEKMITKEGECCIYCSYADIPCYSAQFEGSACCGEFTS